MKNKFIIILVLLFSVFSLNLNAGLLDAVISPVSSAIGADGASGLSRGLLQGTSSIMSKGMIGGMLSPERGLLVVTIAQLQTDILQIIKMVKEYEEIKAQAERAVATFRDPNSIFQPLADANNMEEFAYALTGFGDFVMGFDVPNYWLEEGYSNVARRMNDFMDDVARKSKESAMKWEQIGQSYNNYILKGLYNPLSDERPDSSFTYVDVIYSDMETFRRNNGRFPSYRSIRNKNEQAKAQHSMTQYYREYLKAEGDVREQKLLVTQLYSEIHGGNLSSADKKEAQDELRKAYENLREARIKQYETALKFTNGLSDVYFYSAENDEHTRDGVAGSSASFSLANKLVVVGKLGGNTVAKTIKGGTKATIDKTSNLFRRREANTLTGTEIGREYPLY